MLSAAKHWLCQVVKSRFTDKKTESERSYIVSVELCFELRWFAWIEYLFTTMLFIHVFTHNYLLETFYMAYNL